MEIPLYIVDAFTNTVFRGNPAAVCPLDDWPDDALMQSIAAENNLAETAFLVPEGEGYGLRWFTPKVEVDLCGHATLASTFVLSLDKSTAADLTRFQTRSGEVTVRSADGWFTLDFPARTLEDLPEHDAAITKLEAALGLRPEKITRAAGTWIAEYGSEKSILSITPDFAAVATLECKGLIITAPGENSDFVSRFFAPRVGINEDAVTGSAHCGLIPYWHRKTGKTDMLAFQVSERGGELRCRYALDRVGIGGQAVLFSQGTIRL